MDDVLGVIYAVEKVGKDRFVWAVVEHRQDEGDVPVPEVPKKKKKKRKKKKRKKKKN